MALEFCRFFINTPGELLENRRFYPATLFTRRVLGVVSRAEAPENQVERAKRFLQNAGAKEIVCWNTETGEGLEVLKSLIF